MSLLSPSDPAPFLRISGPSPFLIVCDHAGDAVPAGLCNQGLEESPDLAPHRRYDPGAAELSRALADRLSAPAVLGVYSRLVIDLNRDPDCAATSLCPETGIEIPGSIVEKVDGIFLPANAALGVQARAQRQEEIFIPYHAEISRQMAGREALISIHSFSRRAGPVRRPWDVGVMWYRDKTLAGPMLEDLARRNPGWVIGDNQPYSLQAPGVWQWNYTTRVHAEEKGIPNLLLEICQDQIDTPEKARQVAEVLSLSLRYALRSLNAAV